MATKRKSISKKIRFEVFKRDGFKCQYCGAKSPDVLLHVDHIEPVSKGGANDVMNLITSCEPCNLGKSDVRLDDDSVIKKQRDQIDLLNERREQLEMMLEWRNGLRSIDDEQIEAVSKVWSSRAIGWSLNESGEKELRSYLKKHGLQSVLKAIDESADAYIVLDDQSKATKESVMTAWNKVGSFLRLHSMPDAERRCYYIKGILKNRLSYVPVDCISLLIDAVRDDVDVNEIEAAAKACKSWTQFKNELTKLVMF
jgi:hypothetical protein